MSKAKKSETVQTETTENNLEQTVTPEASNVSLTDLLDKMQKEKKKYLRIKKLF